MITAEPVGNRIVVLEPNGRLTAETADEFTQAVAKWLVHGRQDIILDLRYVSYMDSAGLGALAQAYTSSRKRGGRVVFTHVAGKNLELLRITKLLTVFEVYDSPTTAQSSFAGQREASDDCLSGSSAGGVA
jgi:anti-sigma B factor antagonist